MSIKQRYFAILALFVSLLVACGPNTTGSGNDGPDDNQDAATAAAVAYLAGELGVAEEEIEVVSSTSVDFTDSCLGLGGPAESCLQAITPGWLVMLNVSGTAYEVRTDETGEQVRIAAEEATGDGAADTAAAAAQEFLAGELGVALGDVQVLSTEAAEFSDSCLGLGGPAESCLQVMTPGWIVMAEVSGQTYEVHTDQTGEQVRVAN